MVAGLAGTPSYKCMGPLYPNEMKHFVLTIEEGTGPAMALTQHTIKAKSRQHVKYWYHKTLKSWGYSDSPHGDKHLLQGPHGWTTEIFEITEVSPSEFDVLDEHIYSWTKVDE